jgi:tetratricopeptide (TPR) repeat protein
MKKYLVFILIMVCGSPLLSQDALEFYNQGIEMAYEKKYDEAIKLFTKAIEVEPNHSNIHFAWYNRGLAKSFKKDYKNAIIDFDSALVRKSDYFLAINMRGVCKKNLKDYTGAIGDYTLILQLDSNYSDALINRGNAFELSGQLENACLDWKKATLLGNVVATRIYNKTCLKAGEKKLLGKGFYEIESLAPNADRQYGFNKDNPVKVGTGLQGGPANQEAYLELLRDSNGKKIQYERTGSCCHYETENGLMGMGALDMYEIKYSEPNGKLKRAVIYITFYDYEEPKILYGFKSVSN